MELVKSDRDASGGRMEPRASMLSLLEEIRTLTLRNYV